MTNRFRLKTITDDGAIELCRAIIAQADGDLLRWQKHGDGAVVNIADLKRFYRGSLFSSISGGIDPEWYMRAVLNRKARAKKAYVRSAAERRRMNAAANF